VDEPSPPTRLARRLGTFDAVVVGLGSMVGAGVFVAFAPAARAAGNGLLLGLGIAALVASCNASSSARLAVLSPKSGGAYVYGSERLGPLWGNLAGLGFIAGKIASSAAMALTFGAYAAPEFAQPLAVAAVLALTALSYFGVERSVSATKVIVAAVLSVLALFVAAVWLGGSAEVARLWPVRTTPLGVLESAGFLFFAFAGYARVTTLGEEVLDPVRTIPRALTFALGLTLVLYVLVAVSVLAGAGAVATADSAAPLVTALEAGRFAWLSPAIRIGATFASLGALLSLLLGISRTTFAMAANRDLPALLAAVHPRYRVPHRAELAVGCLVALVVALADVRGALGVSSFLVLVYYAIANAAAWTLRIESWLSRAVPAAGVAGCLGLAASLPASAAMLGALVLALGGMAYAVRTRSR
jgi:basic amino acid/polyamine antiporter, APA family